MVSWNPLVTPRRRSARHPFPLFPAHIALPWRLLGPAASNGAVSHRCLRSPSSHFFRCVIGRSRSFSSSSSASHPLFAQQPPHPLFLFCRMDPRVEAFPVCQEQRPLDIAGVCFCAAVNSFATPPSYFLSCVLSTPSMRHHSPIANRLHGSSCFALIFLPQNISIIRLKKIDSIQP